MIQKPFAAFGYVLIANYYTKGEQFDVISTIDSKTFLFCSSGNTTGTDKLTGRVIETYTAGWTNSGINTNQEYTNIVNEDSVCWCYDPKLNKGFIPEITPIIIKMGEVVEIKNMTKLFVCEGVLTIEGKQFTGPMQLHIKSGDKVVTAETGCYGLQFE